ncbi:DUF397 domain-containing protein [Streptomyces sp. A0642]|uniref:DUF397 domain-containing protein n=1 Tax=Streptomyces sp. A0642 TaxID=2563100 RepID=UPI0010A20B03|nr:DUF397 domain-containing protein [Streptomyces sp. A0642]THA72482.1 DUF397 domain-containing protein [Streptomyces sp. A0642]
MKAQEPSTNLYDRSVEGDFSYLCNGNGTEESMESCLSLAQLNGGGYAIRDTKAEGAGRELRGTSSELLSFAQHVIDKVGPSATA